MKQIFLFFFFSLIVTATQAQIVNIPDTNFKNTLLNHIPAIDTNRDGEIQVNEAESTIRLNLYSKSINDLTGIEFFINLEYLDVSRNSLTAINLDSNVNLNELNISDNQLVSLELTKNILLEGVFCSDNKIVSLDLSNNPLLLALFCDKNNLVNLNINSNTLLLDLNVEFNFDLASLDLSNNVALTYLYCRVNSFKEIDLSNNTELILANFIGNKLTELDISQNIKLESLRFYGTPIRFLDTSNNPNLNNLICPENYFLEKIILKNKPADLRLTADSCPNLRTICVDDVDYAIANYINNVPPRTAFVEDCSVNIEYNTIEGIISIDENNSGCDVTDPIIPNTLVKVTDGTNNFASLTDSNGAFSIPVLENTYETIPTNLSNNININLNPTSHTNTFIGFDNAQIANFCAVFNQNTYDLNIKLIPISQARPGFDSRYQLVYENLGLTADNGSITLTFDDTMQSFVNASPTENSSTPNTIVFNFSDLKPFEKRVIDISMNTFTPPTVNGDDILNFEAVITPNSSDATPEDNIFNLSQIVVNSFDPNDKQVLQGTEITQEQTDEYLDYLIRFQNTGTASAINVAITDYLSNKLDWDTIKIISSSHNYTTRITNGNFVEFIFDNINLPAEQDDEPASHGFVAFKIKPKSDIVVGDRIRGSANIYFDFNAPIITNTVSTEVKQALSVNEFQLQNSVSIYPNPIHDRFSIKKSKGIQVKSTSIYSVTGKQLPLIQNGNTDEYEINQYPSGIYFIKIETDKGVVNKKLVKK